MSEKSKGELLKEQLYFKQKNGFEHLSEEETDKAYAFCEGYKTFIDAGKTEREVVNVTVKMLEEAGFKPYEYGHAYNPGDGVYINNRGKSVLAARFGKKTAAHGVNVIASHIDSPRIDLKQRPLYEDAGFAYFKTHYYGGIRKYQWMAIPLSLHGVVYKKDGSCAEICIGEAEEDPVFTITDLLPHLGADQSKKALSEAFPGEGLNILIGSRKFKDDKVSDKIKLNILSLLNEKYGIIEEDFISAELSIVPTCKAKDIGFDRSLIGAYGQDDRVCSYPPLIAIIENTAPELTSILWLADKEEVGSEGNTGAQSKIFPDFMADIAQVQEIDEKAVFAASKCLSADVNACFDPNYSEAYDKKNSAQINCGVVVTKYTGTRGKSGSSDASAEYVSYIRTLFDNGGVIWQTGELGKVDQGGGGTVAKYIANLNIDTIDVGVPVLSMHAPFETTSKIDVYMMYLASKTFFA